MHLLMPIMAIEDIVKSMVNRGMTKEQILDSLIEMGVTEDTATEYVEKAMKEANVQQKPQKSEEILDMGSEETNVEAMQSIVSSSSPAVSGELANKIDELIALSKSIIELNKQILDANRKVLIRLERKDD